MIEPGETFSYEFVASPSGTFVYHTHHNSAEQEAKGLFGIFRSIRRSRRSPYDREVLPGPQRDGGFFLINGKAFPATEPIQAKSASGC